MIRPMFASLAIALAPFSAATAAPEDYQEHLPVSIHDMELKEWDITDDKLIAYYGETIGRATLWVIPAPEADPKGAHEQEAQLSGETPASQLVLMERIAKNLREGTGALGDGYAFSAVRTVSIRLDGHDAIDDVPISCGVIERHQAEDADRETRLDLVDRICTIQHGEDVLVSSITTPHDEGQRPQIEQAQLTFTGLLLGALVRDINAD